MMVGYGLLAMGIFLLDRVTKWMALVYLQGEYRINNLISFDLVMNRGISWSMFHSTSQAVFILLSCMITAIIVFLAHYTLMRWHQGELIIGEVLTLAGAISNLIDRVWYGGVIDFIQLSVGSWNFPVFNGADIFIVTGIGIMVLCQYE